MENPDDNWGETTTVVTGTTSEIAFCADGATHSASDVDDKTVGFFCARYAGALAIGFMSTIAFLSPICMVVLPRIGIDGWYLPTCDPDCEGRLISLAFKLLILLIGTWALFLRRPKSTMPRIFVYRAVVLFLVFLLTFSYWLFYGVRIFRRTAEDVEYRSVVAFAASLADSLLFVHYLAVVLVEIRQLQPQYVARVVRSPDGEMRSYAVGQLSIQRLAIHCLELYHRDFRVFNPYLESVASSSRRAAAAGRMTEFKVYDLDGGGVVTGTEGMPAMGSRAVLAAAARHRDAGHNERFYEEQEYERRVARRRARLKVAAEEAFTHIKRRTGEQGLAFPSL